MSMPKSKRKVNPFISKIAKVKFGYGNLRADFGVYLIGLNLSVSNEFLNTKVTELSSFTFIDCIQNPKGTCLSQSLKVSDVDKKSE